MNKKKVFLISLISIATSFSLVSVAHFSSNGVKRVSGSSCLHTHVEEYDAVAPSLDNEGLMHHYACCECHTAWSDENLTNEIGNTVTDRSKIDIPKKAATVAIDKNTLGDDLIKGIDSSSPNVCGLDQTDWQSSSNGKGSGTFTYYQIDNKKAVRLSTETLTNQKYQTLDTYSSGYSSFRFVNDICGYVTTSFDYKYYDLDYDFYSFNYRILATWYDKDSAVEVQKEFELLPDNIWHSVVISSDEIIDSHSFSIKIHHFKGELFISNLSMYSPSLEAPVVSQFKQGIKFNTIANADYYLIHDNNNNPSEIKILDSESSSGVITYNPVAAGLHDIYVTAHTNDNSLAPSTSNIIYNIEVAPVFFYDNFANECYVNKSYFESKAKWTLLNKHELYTYKDKFNLTDDGTYYHSYIDESGNYTTNANERTNFVNYEEGSNLYKVIENAKELGTNVINVCHSDGILTSTQKLEDNVQLKAIMDAAYLNNLKVTVIANEIYGPSANGENEASIRSSIYNYLNNYGLSLIQHPAFYGFVLCDEPQPTGGKIEKAAYAAKACIDYFNEYYYSKNLSVRCPFFICALLQYTTASDGLFQTEASYKEYVEKWLTLTGLNYYSSDIYTYTTQSYGCDEVTSDNYRIYLDLKSKYAGLRYHLTITSNNDIDNRSSCNVYDIFGSTLYAAAFNDYGVSRYTYYPAIWTYHWKNGIVNRDGSKTANYNYVVKAQSQFEFLQNELYGYDVTSMSYLNNGNYNSSSANTRMIEAELSNGFNNCSVTVNYNSQSNYNSTYQKYVPSGSIYYMLGNNYSITPIASNGVTVTLNNGEGVFITHEIETSRDVVMSHREIAGNFGEIGSGADCVDMNVDVSGNYLDLNITGNNPGVWLNRDLHGASTFTNAVNVSQGFDVVFKGIANKNATIRIIEKLGDNYYAKSYQLSGQTTGNWDTIEIRNLDSNLDAIRLEFIGEFASINSFIQIKEIVFKDVEGPYLTFEAKYDAYVIDKLNQISGFDSSSVTITENGQYESDMTYQKSTNNSYIFKFKYSYANKLDSVFFFIGCSSWKGFEFIVLSNKHTQIDVYDNNGSFVASSGTSFYTMDETNTDYMVEFHIIRLKDGSNKVYLATAINGLLWNQMLIDDPDGCKNNVIGIYDYSANNGAGTTLKDY